MDLHMPELDGVAATAEITRVAPGVAVLVLSMLDDDESLFAAIRAGARGYLVKGAGQEEIIRAITAVASGEVVFGPGIARQVLAYFAASRPAQPTFPELTARERQVLDLFAAGLYNATIAARLGLSTKPSATTPRPSSRSFRSPIGPRQSCAPARSRSRPNLNRAPIALLSSEDVDPVPAEARATL
jgi:FixJ family two-component response regulator